LKKCLNINKSYNCVPVLIVQATRCSCFSNCLFL